MKRQLLTLFTTLLSPALLSQSAFGRDMYFAANAVSNWTAESVSDAYSIANMGCTWDAANTRYACSIPVMKCRVMIQNLSLTSQRVGVQIFHNILGTTLNPSHSLINKDALRDTSNNDLAYSQIADVVATSYWTGSSTAANATTLSGPTSVPAVPLASPVTVVPDGFLYVEKTLFIPPFYIQGAPDGSITATPFQNYWPWAKWFNTCTGKIRVVDGDSSNPGFVIASGSLDYIGSSYQNEQRNFGGFNSWTGNTLDIWTRADALAKSAGIARCQSTAWGGGYNFMETYGFGYCSATARAYSRCAQTVTTDNSHKSSAAQDGNASSMRPLQIHQVPITINGGSPF